jgi:hypothetical protein
MTPPTGRANERQKNTSLRAAELGLGEGFFRIAEIHLIHHNWDDARLFLKRAAEKLHVVALGILAKEAQVSVTSSGLKLYR